MGKMIELSLFIGCRVSRFCTSLFLLVFLLTGCQPAEESKELHLGDTAPDFAIKTMDGDVIVLSSLKGQGVILRFFETNCRFCKADTPAFIDYYNKVGKEKLTVLYVGSFYESEDSLRAFTEELGVNFPVAMDQNGRLAKQYNILAYPQTLFIGKNMELLAAILGGVGSAELEEIMGKQVED